MSGLFLSVLFGATAILDAACAAYRQDAGRLATIDKRREVGKSARRGALAGIAADGIALVWLGVVGADARHDLAAAARAAAVVAIPMVVVFVAATIARTASSNEFRALASGVLFGPLTFIRPYAMVICGLVAVAASPHVVVVITVVMFWILAAWWTRFPWPLMSATTLRNHVAWADITRDVGPY